MATAYAYDSGWYMLVYSWGISRDGPRGFGVEVDEYDGGDDVIDIFPLAPHRRSCYVMTSNLSACRHFTAK